MDVGYSRLSNLSLFIFIIMTCASYLRQDYKSQTKKMECFSSKDLRVTVPRSSLSGLKYLLTQHQSL